MYGDADQLGQWEAITEALSPLAKLFGGDGAARRAAKTEAAQTGGQRILTSIGDLNTLVKKIEDMVSGTTLFFDCPKSARSTQMRSCFVAACQAARQLGWQDPQYGDCNPYLKAPLSFEEFERSVLSFFTQILPNLKQAAAAPIGAPTPPPPILITTPPGRPPLTTAGPWIPPTPSIWTPPYVPPAPPPTYVPSTAAPAPAVQQLGMGFDPMWLLVGGGAALLFVTLAGQGGRGRK